MAKTISLAFAMACGLSASALAADLVVKAPPKVAQSYSNYYVWIDGSYQSIRLPAYDLGWFSGNNPVVGIERHRPRATGGGVSGGIGYSVPGGVLPFFPGRNARVELAAYYVSADATNTGAIVPTVNVGAQLASGALPGGVGCAASIPPCRTASTLQTDYTAWRIEIKAASDILYGPLTLTPSIALFGGTASTDQAYSQALSAAALIATYFAAGSVDWNDIGIKAGLVGRYAVMPGVTAALGGSVGVARRSVDLSIADSYIGTLNGASRLGVDGSTTPVLVNGEASLAWQAWSNWSARVFGGVNYDSRVPGIVRPNIIAGNLVPASIGYEGLTSWYVGGGVAAKFAP